MAHEIRQTDNMAYVGEKPWHGLGVALKQAPSSIEEVFALAHMVWTVHREQLQLSDGRKVDRWAVVRDTDARVLGTVGNDWRPIQHVEKFPALLNPFVKAGQATIETAGTLFDGGRVWALLKIARPDAVIVPKANDTIAKYVLAAVGYDGTLSFTFGITPIRVVCNNTLTASVGDGRSRGGGHVRIRHTAGGNEAVDALAATINAVDAQIEKAAEVFRALAGVQIRDAKQLRAYVEAVFPAPKKAPKALAAPSGQGDTFADLLQRPAQLGNHKTVFSGAAPMLAQPTEEDQEEGRRIFDRILHLFERGKGNNVPGVAGTAWAAYNAVTEYNTWERGRSVDNRLNNVWLAQSGPVARALPAAVDTFLS
jgi:phage/plasmid-like protein (TIGR03299 family)